MFGFGKKSKNQTIATTISAMFDANEDISRAKSKNNTSNTPVSSIQFQAPFAPPSRGTFDILTWYNSSPWLRSVVTRKADAVASSRFLVATPAKAVRARGSITSALARGEKIDDIISKNQYVISATHRVNDILDEPCKIIGRIGFLKTVSRYIDLCGEAFIYKSRAKDGSIDELIPISPTWVNSVPSETDDTYHVVSTYALVNKRINAKDMIWIRDPDVADPFGRSKGISTSISDELDVDELAVAMLKARFLNGNAPNIVITTKGMNSERVKEMKQDWDAKHLGAGNYGKTLFYNGELDIREIGSTLVDSQFYQLREQHRDFITQVFGVPPEILGIVENSNRATVDAAYSLFMRLCILPMLTIIIEGLNKGLRGEYKDPFLIVFDSAIPEDREYKKAIMAEHPHAFSVNEIRRAAGEKEIEGGNVYIAKNDIQSFATPQKITITPTINVGIDGDKEPSSKKG